MKTTEIEQQLKDKSHKEIEETFDKMFDTLYQLYDKYSFRKDTYIYLVKQGHHGAADKEIPFSSLEHFKTNMQRMIKADITERMVQKKTKDLLLKLELL